MNPHDIKALIGKQGVRQIQIARKLKVTPGMVNAVIFSKSKSRRVATAISRVVGLPLAELWPQHYAKGSARRAA